PARSETGVMDKVLRSLETENLCRPPPLSPRDLDLLTQEGEGRHREQLWERWCRKINLRGRDRRDRRLHGWLGLRCGDIGVRQCSQPRPQGVDGALDYFLLFGRQSLQLHIELGLHLLQEPDHLHGRFRSRLTRQLPRKIALEGTL